MRLARVLGCRLGLHPRGWRAPLSPASQGGASGTGWGLLAGGGVGVPAGRQSVGLVLDLYGDTRQGVGVLPAVVCAEQELSGSGKYDAYIGLRAAPVAQVQ